VLVGAILDLRREMGGKKGGEDCGRWLVM
jgi:hypothetical protein